MKIANLHWLIPLLVMTGCSGDIGDEPSSTEGPPSAPGESLEQTMAPPRLESSGATAVIENKAASYFEVAFDSHWDGAFGTIPVGVWLAPSSDYLCVLSQVLGNFGDDGWSTIFDFPSASPAGWYGRGRGRAICVKWSSFPNGSGNWKRWWSDDSIVHMNFDSPSYEPAFCGRQTNIPHSSACGDQWQGDALTFVNAINGEMEGGGEYAEIFQSTSGTGYNRLIVSTQASDLAAWGVSAFVGVPGGTRRVRLAGRTTGNVLTTGFYGDGNLFTADVTSKVGQGPQTYWMVPSSLAFCALTRVSGNFNGGGEKLTITEQTAADGVKHWVLSAVAGGGSVYGSARCMAYDQR